MIEAVFTTGVDEITAHGLTQWDKGQKLKIMLSSLPASFEVHFAFKRSETAYVVDAVASNGIATVSIPNAILRQPADAMAWIYLVNGDAGETVKTIHLPIERRTKPADYVYEEAEVANFREIVNQRIDEYFESGVIVPGATVEEVTKIKEFTINQVEFEHTGNPAQFDSFSGCPLNCVTHIEPIQPGYGDPSPSNVRPISGRTSAELTRCGKNLFDKDSALLNSWYSYSPETHGVQSWNGLFASKLIPVRPGEVFTLTNYLTDISCALVKYLVSETDTGGLSAIRSGDVITCDGTKQIYTFTIPDRARYIGITGDMANIDKVQLELGTAPSPFEPYQGDTFSASFGQTVYGGTLDWNTGELAVDMGYAVFNGSENWSVYTYADGRKSFYTSGTGKLSGIADRFINIPGVCSWSPTAEDGCIRDVLRTDVGSTEIEIKPDVLSKWGINDLDTFKARLAANPMQIAYQLANSITIQLTPAQLTALQGMNNIFCDAGETTVSGRKDILWLTDYLLKRVKELESAVATLQTAAVNNV